MRDRGYFIQGDLERAMKQEARAANQSEAETAYFDGLHEIDDVEVLEEERINLAEGINDTESKIQKLQHQIRELEREKEKFERRHRHVQNRIQDVDPEIVIELKAFNTKRYGWQLGTDIVKVPPTPNLDPDDDPSIAGRNVSEIVLKAFEEFTNGIDLSEYDNNEHISTLTFTDLEDNNPTITTDTKKEE